MPLGPPTTPSPAAPVNAGAGATPSVGPAGPAVAATSAGASAAAAPTPVPVSAARAERDAIATAASAGALRRQNRGNDPTQLARRIAAALNVGLFDFGFYWVTALTTEGSIVVANSYGIGYIPANVLLPEQVHMATAGESIPVGERARWATYPVLSLQGWARHHGERLRAVIATEDQFEGFDPGAAKIILHPDDIPEDGTMQGRTRLEVLAPKPAAKLAATRDERLTDLLPPAQSELNPPENDLAMSWFEVSKPLMSRSAGRVRAHLEAMSAYAEQAMGSALHKAQTQPEFRAQRAAIADWVYWQHQHSILAEALENPVGE
ncbi:MAG: secretion protein EccK [Mycobacterium sp.]|nr:secretion protein EccK [Mycobacterium sp.]